MHTLVDEHALGCAADLPGAEEATEDSALRGTCEIGVLTHDDGAVAAALDQRALEPGRTHDLVRRHVRADEADAVDPWMVTSFSPTSPAP